MDTILKAAYFSLVLVLYALHIAVGGIVAWTLTEPEHAQWEAYY